MEPDRSHVVYVTSPTDGAILKVPIELDMSDALVLFGADGMTIDTTSAGVGTYGDVEVATSPKGPIERPVDPSTA